MLDISPALFLFGKSGSWQVVFRSEAEDGRLGQLSDLGKLVLMGLPLEGEYFSQPC